MGLFCNKLKHVLVLLHFVYYYIMLWLFITNPKAEAAVTKERGSNITISAILVFGDSTVDPGNNNVVKTVFRSNFSPYGRDFLNHRPTGRFTDGRLVTDYLASYLGFKEYLPPYLEPNLTIEELMPGVSFASAGSGFDPLTPEYFNVIPMQKQLEYFKEYKKTLEAAMGKQRTENHIKNAAFVMSAGTNDFFLNYIGHPVRRATFTISQYQQFVLQHCKDFVQGLWAEGARRIAVVGLPPIGCLPLVITFHSNNTLFQRGNCIANYTLISTQYNLMLQNYLNSMQTSLAHSGARIRYVDIFNPLMNMITQGHEKFGFDVVDRGCCGTGYLEFAILCNPASFLCADSNKYLFWDAVHPTQKAYYNILEANIPVIESITKG